tara:strand:- start:862 stop:1083 length:222 start_codon:yes stop_codon:yes gene_type:complete
MVVETVVALLMIVNHEIKEHRIQESMSICLKGKRVAERQLKGGSSVQYKCLRSKAELETDSLGNVHIKKLILE